MHTPHLVRHARSYLPALTLPSHTCPVLLTLTFRSPLCPGPASPPKAAGPGDAVSREVPAGSGDMADPRGPSAAAESGGAAAAIPQIPGTPNAPGPGGDTAPGAGVLSNRVFQLYPIPGAPVGQAAAGVGVWARGGLEGCRLRSLKYRRRVLWEAGGYGSGVVWLSVHGGEEKHPEVIRRVER